MFNLFGRSNVKKVNVNEMDALIGKIKLIDIREKSEFAEGSIKSAVNIPMGDLLANPGKYLDKEETYYIMCRSGGRSASAANKLDAQGYKVVNVAGGVMNYSGNFRS